MKKMLMALSLLVSILAPAATSAQTHDRNGFSLGLILGDPTGLTLRTGLGGRHALQAHFGFSPFPGDAAAVMVDWTYDTWDFLRNNSTTSLWLYLGAGGKAQWFTGKHYFYDQKHDHDYFDDSHYGLGVRGVVGIRASFNKAPFDVFCELAPVGVLAVVPDAGPYFDADFAIGGRYRF